MAGRFEDHIAEYLYNISMDGCDLEIGSVYECGWWHGLIRGPFDSDAPAELHNAAGAILSEDEHGFVYYQIFESEDDMWQSWQKIEDEISYYYPNQED